MIQVNAMKNVITAKNTVILPNFLVCKFFGREQFCITSGDLPKTMRKLFLYGIFGSVIMPVIHFLNGPLVNLLFCCQIILSWEKVTSYKKFSLNLTFEVQIVWKILAFQCYWWKYRNAENRSISKNILRGPNSEPP